MSLLAKTNGGLRAKSMFPKSFFNDDFFTMNWPSIDLWDDNGFKGDWIPAANVKETEKAFTVELTTPGYTKKDIHVKVDANNVLHISAEQKKETKEEKENYTRKEFSYGSFNRSFALPESIDNDNIKAKCENGVLSVELPKKKEAAKQKEAKEIKIA